jgi:hypothetical protein
MLRMMKKLLPTLIVTVTSGFATAVAAQGSPSAPSADSPGPWPRQVPLSNGIATIYQPQVVQWQDDDLEYRAAVSVRFDGSTGEDFGVVWAQSRTEVDQVSRMVQLDDILLMRVNFPSVADGGAQVLSDLRQFFAANPPDAVPLDLVQASLGVAQTARPGGIAVNNDPPQIIVSTNPALLVTVHGDPVLRPVPGTKLQRVINTRALILRGGDRPPYYLHVYDGWMQADSLDGPWQVATDHPASLDAAARQLSSAGTVDLLDGGPDASRRLQLASGVPVIHVADGPAELVVFKGQPDFVPITGTGLLWANNTAASVIVDTATNLYYVLLSGRWFRSSSLQGPWSHVANNTLPAAFARIPSGSAAGVVLATVAGTPQAQEAVIAATIPQTATVPRANAPSFTPAFDGAPQFVPIEGTPLSYVANSDLPLIRVSNDAYYAVQAGVWFTANGLTGPWSVAISVPPVIYTIPPSSPLFYVTYVKIYDSTPDSVYVGYTSGYTGSVVSSDGTVVYGTGYWYTPWIGDAFYPVPLTWGIAADPIYNPAVGFAFGFAVAAAADPYWFWGTPYYAPAYWGTPCCGTVSTATNVYRAYGNTVASGTRTWYQDSNGKIGTTAQGTYANARTGTTGSYDASRSFNPNTGKLDTDTSRTFDTAGGASGSVNRSAQYDAATGGRTYDSNLSATTAGGSSIDRSVSASDGSGGFQRDASTTFDDARTGQTYTRDSGSPRSDYFAGDDGSVYRSGGDGWQRWGGDGGWQNAGRQDWADREAGARDDAGARFGGFGDRGFGGGGDFGGGWGGGRAFGGGFRGGFRR